LIVNRKQALPIARVEGYKRVPNRCQMIRLYFSLFEGCFISDFYRPRCTIQEAVVGFQSTCPIAAAGSVAEPTVVSTIPTHGLRIHHSQSFARTKPQDRPLNLTWMPWRSAYQARVTVFHEGESDPAKRSATTAISSTMVAEYLEDVECFRFSLLAAGCYMFLPLFLDPEPPAYGFALTST